ncbi:MAG TPA: NADPH-dependent F420 reductase [Terriglobales bacterium]|nr:NADPH-dependent F420 reductase [Terriglobales bacterium]
MTIAIVGGTGPEGSGLALRWAQAGENVIIGSRDAKRASEKAAELNRLPALGAGVPAPAQISDAENSEACRKAEIIVLTVPFQSHAETLKHLKPIFRAGQLLVDATVPLAASVGGRPTRTLGVWQGSAAEQAAELVPEGVTVVAAFHNVAADLLHRNGTVDCDVIVCSDDKDAAKRVRALARKIPGVRSVDGGKLENARIIESITALIIGINIRHKTVAGIRITGLPPAAYDI